MSSDTKTKSKTLGKKRPKQTAKSWRQLAEREGREKKCKKWKDGVVEREMTEQKGIWQW